jgi:hypothetical protein
MNLLDYPAPLSSELKRLGYNLYFQPNDQDVLLMKLIFNDSYSELEADIQILNDWHIRDCCISAIRVYAYYINNPFQFRHDPHNIILSSIKQSFNTALSFLNFIYNNKPNHIVKVKVKLIHRFSDQCISIWYDSANQLAKRVKYNTMLARNDDLNLLDKVGVDLFR